MMTLPSTSNPIATTPVHSLPPSVAARATLPSPPRQHQPSFSYKASFPQSPSSSFASHGTMEVSILVELSVVVPPILPHVPPSTNDTAILLVTRSASGGYCPTGSLRKPDKLLSTGSALFTPEPTTNLSSTAIFTSRLVTSSAMHIHVQPTPIMHTCTTILGVQAYASAQPPWPWAGLPLTTPSLSLVQPHGLDSTTESACPSSFLS